MYLVTDDTNEQMRFTQVSDAREYASTLALAGRLNVTVWLRTHTVEAETTLKWEEHAKGLTGNGG